MTRIQQLITIAVMAIATMATRFIPFLLFSGKRKTPAYIDYLGMALPAAVFSMLIVYCLKNVTITAGSHGLPELISIAIVAALHLWKKQTLLSIAGGTIAYMALVQLVFI